MDGRYHAGHAAGLYLVTSVGLHPRLLLRYLSSAFVSNGAANRRMFPQVLFTGTNYGDSCLKDGECVRAVSSVYRILVLNGRKGCLKLYGCDART